LVFHSITVIDEQHNHNLIPFSFFLIS